jgi:hypothetical protein
MGSAIVSTTAAMRAACIPCKSQRPRKLQLAGQPSTDVAVTEPWKVYEASWFSSAPSRTSGHSKVGKLRVATCNPKKKIEKGEK